MKRFQGALAGVIVTLLLVACGSAVADSRTENDHVLHDGKDGQYQEYFKQEGNGDKNYLFTVSQQIDAPAPGKCIVVTGDSEQWGTVACNPTNR